MYISFGVLQGNNDSEVTAPCANASVYTGEVCKDVLQEASYCHHGMEYLLLEIPSTIDQQRTEEDAVRLLETLPGLTPNKDCIEGMTTMICQELFGFCDINGTVQNLDADTCEVVNNFLCPDVYAAAQEFFGSDNIINCENLERREVCIGRCVPPHICQHNR